MIRLPVAKIRDKVLTDFTSGVCPGVSIEAHPIPDGFEICKPYRKEYTPIVAHFAAASLGNFGFDPLATHAGWGNNQQKPVKDADGFVDLLVDLLAALHVMRREPAANASCLQIGK